MQTLLTEARKHTLRAHLCCALTALLVVCGSSLLLVSAASATAYTWNGEGLASADTWSNAANWVGGSAPASSSTISTLTFPAISRSACFVFTPAEACYVSANDLTGLSVEQLQIDNTEGDDLSGNGFTLGSGGLVTTGSLNGFATIATPITLGASQTWNVSGGPGGDWLTILGALSGTGSTLSVNLSHAGALYLGGFAPSSADNEVGSMAVASSDSDQGETFGLSSTLNASDGHSLTVHGVSFDPLAASTGPFISIDAVTDIGTFAYDPALEATTGVSTTLTSTSATFDAASTVDLPITGSGTQAGSDYSQLVSTGNLSLGGATLDVSDDFVGGCPVVPAGQVDTIISTTGTLTSTFGNASNGSTITTICLSPQYQTTTGQQYRINYNTSSSPQTVTATAISSGGTPNESSPSGSGTTPSPGNSSSVGSAPTSGISPIGSAANTVSPAQLTALLAQQLTPSGKTVKLAALLKNGGFTIPFRALEAGTATVVWYLLPSSAKLAKKTAAKPILVASGKLAFSTAGAGKLKLTLTTAGKRLLTQAKRVKLTAQGTFVTRGGPTVKATRGVVVGR